MHAEVAMATVRLRLAAAGTATALAAAGVAGAAAWAQDIPALGPAARSAIMVAVWLLWVGTRKGNHRGTTLGAAVWITLGRGVLVGLLAAAVGVPPELLPATGLALVGLVALVLDGVDGAVARRTGHASEFGGSLDMELDALTVLLLSALCLWLGRAGPWVLVAGALRYAFGLAANVSATLATPLDAFPPRRIVAGLAVSGLSLALLPQLGPTASTTLAAAVVAVLCWSFGRDAVWQWRQT